MKKQEGLVKKKRLNTSKKVALGIFLILILLSLSRFIVSIQKTNNNDEVDKLVEQHREKLTTIKIDKYLEFDQKDINNEIFEELEKEIEVLRVLNKNIKSDKMLSSSDYAKEQKQKLLVDLEKISIKISKQEKILKTSLEEIKIKEEKERIETEQEKEENNESEKPVRDQEKANITPNSKPQTKPQPKPNLKPETTPEDSEPVQSSCSNGAQKRSARYVEYFSPSGELVSKDRIDECGLAWDFFTGEYLYDTTEWQ